MSMNELRNATPDETRRLEALRAVLLAEMEREAKTLPDQISVYCFRDSYGGVRISEIDYVWNRENGGMSGTSWMASDFDASGVLFAAERYLMHCLEPVEDYGNDSRYDPEQEARQLLQYHLRGGNDAEIYNALTWEERDENPLAKETV